MSKNWYLVAILGLVMTGCGSKQPEPRVDNKRERPKKVEGSTEATPSATTTAQATKATVEGFGTITGRVVFGGSAWSPKSSPLDSAHGDYAFCKGGGDSLDQDMYVVDNTSKGVQFIYVYLEGKPAAIHSSYPQTAQDVAKADEAAFFEKYKVKLEAKELDAAIAANKVAVKDLIANSFIDQVYCRYLPRAQAARVGSKLLIKNPDKVNHNINISGTKNADNFNMPANTVVIFDRLKVEAGNTPVPIKCNVHGWMAMSLIVFDHPYFAVTGKDGSFKLVNVPAGKVRIGARTADNKIIESNVNLTVAPNAEVTYEFKLNP